MTKFLLKALTVAGAVVGTLGLSDYMKQNVRKNFGNDRLIALEMAGMTEGVVDLLHKHGADDVGHQDGNLHVKLSPEAVAALKEEGAEFMDHTEEFISNMETNLNDPNFFCYEGAEACARKTQDEFYASYQPLDAILTRLEDLRLLNTDMTYFESIGESYEGRSLDTMFIGDQTKPLVYYFCGIHAREWIVPMFCTYMAEMLIAGGEGHPLLDTLSFAILPSANPDGYIYSMTTDNSWRKTRQPNPGSDCMGTDGNRNYPTGWGGPGASADTCSQVYHGHSPLDNKETAAIAAFALANKDRMLIYNDAHAYGEYWMCPYAGTFDLPPAADYDKMETCHNAAYDAILAVHGLEFKIGSIANTIYIASGGSVDWFYEEVGVVYSYTLEARGAGLSGLAGFYPPPENILPSNEELFAGMAASSLCAYNLEFGAPTEFPTAAPTACEDLDPNGISYVDGTPAPCEELGAFCAVYDFVAERCPAECGTCDLAVASRELEVKFINSNKAQATQVSGLVMGVAGAALVGVAAAVVAVVVVKQNKK